MAFGFAILEKSSMQLDLKNFRCYGEKTFTLGRGVTLINGPSGKGKSTIMDAIYYVLYGNLTKPYTYGKKTCSVRLTIANHFVIYRQSGPSKLEVFVNDVTYTDIPAQDIINNIYGHHEDHLATSYLKQSQRSILMTGTNKEKMNLIRSISMGDDDVSQIEAKLSAQSHDINKSYQFNVHQLNTATAVLAEFDSNNKALLSYLSKSDPLYPDLATCTQADLDSSNQSLVTSRANLVQELNNLDQNLKIVLDLESRISSIICTVKARQLTPASLVEIQSRKLALESELASMNDQIAKLNEYNAAKTNHDMRQNILKDSLQRDHAMKIESALASWKQEIQTLETNYMQSVKLWESDKASKFKEYQESMTARANQIKSEYDEKTKSIVANHTLEQTNVHRHHTLELAVLDGEIKSLTEKLDSIKANQAMRLQYEQLKIKQKKEYEDSLEKLTNSKESLVKQLSETQAVVETLSSKFKLFTPEDVNNEMQRQRLNDACWSKIKDELRLYKFNDVEEIAKTISIVDQTASTYESNIAQLATSIENKAWNEARARVLKCPKCASGVIFSDHNLHISEFEPTFERRPVPIPEAKDADLHVSKLSLSKLHDYRSKLESSKAIITMEMSKLVNYDAIVDQDKYKACQDLTKAWLELKRLTSDIEETTAKLDTLIKSRSTSTNSDDSSSTVDPSNANVDRIQEQISEKSKQRETLIRAFNATCTEAQSSITATLQTLHVDTNQKMSELNVALNSFQYREPCPAKPILPNKPEFEPCPEFIPTPFQHIIEGVIYQPPNENLSDAKKHVESQLLMITDLESRQLEYLQYVKQTDVLLEQLVGLQPKKSSKAKLQSIRDRGFDIQDSLFNNIKLSSSETFIKTKSKLEQSLATIDNQVKWLANISEMAKQYQKRVAYQQQIDKLKLQIANESNALQQIAKFVNISKVVERKIMDETVNSLNAVTNHYLAKLFPDEEIQVTFSTTKKLKTSDGKPSKKPDSLRCNTSVYYKNTNIEDINTLSGGEKDRISLAMMLALNTLKSSPLILLDESIHSLHNSAKCDAVELFKSIVADRNCICLVISHEGDSGRYDSILTV